MNYCMIIFIFLLTAPPVVFSTCTASTEESEYCTKSPEDDDNEVRILLVGKTGVGKSTTGNTILGFRAFDNSISATSVTAKTRYNETQRFGKKLIVVDTPGYFDTNRSENETKEEITKWYALVSPGIHAIVLVVEVGRFTKEDQETIEFYIKTFGKDLKDYLVVVFTNKDRLKHNNMTLDSFVNTLKKSSNLRKLIDESRGRYTAIGYKGPEEERVKEVKHILSMINSIKGKDGRNYYSNDVFKKIQNNLDKIEKKRKEELFNQRKSFSKSEYNRIRQDVRSKIRKDIVNDDISVDIWHTLVVIVGYGVLAAAIIL